MTVKVVPCSASVLARVCIGPCGVNGIRKHITHLALAGRYIEGANTRCVETDRACGRRLAVRLCLQCGNTRVPRRLVREGGAGEAEEEHCAKEHNHVAPQHKSVAFTVTKFLQIINTINNHGENHKGIFDRAVYFLQPRRRERQQPPPP